MSRETAKRAKEILSLAAHVWKVSPFRTFPRTHSRLKSASHSVTHARSPYQHISSPTRTQREAHGLISCRCRNIESSKNVKT